MCASHPFSASHAQSYPELHCRQTFYSRNRRGFLDYTFSDTPGDGARNIHGQIQRFDISAKRYRGDQKGTSPSLAEIGILCDARPIEQAILVAYLPSESDSYSNFDVLWRCGPFFSLGALRSTPRKQLRRSVVREAEVQRCLLGGTDPYAYLQRSNCRGRSASVLLPSR
jgi:hypothetical protein